MPSTIDTELYRVLGPDDLESNFGKTVYVESFSNSKSDVVGVDVLSSQGIVSNGQIFGRALTFGFINDLTIGISKNALPGSIADEDFVPETVAFAGVAGAVFGYVNTLGLGLQNIGDIKQDAKSDLTRFQVQFDASSRFRRNITATNQNPADASKRQDLFFLDFSDAGYSGNVDRLINQLDLSLFKKVEKTVLLKWINELLSGVYEILGEFPQMKMIGIMTDDINADKEAIKKNKEEIEKQNKIIFSTTGEFTDTAKAKATKIRSLLTTNITDIQVRIGVKEKFLRGFLSLRSKVLGGDNFQKAKVNKQGNFGKFAARFEAAFCAVHELIFDEKLAAENKQKRKAKLALENDAKRAAEEKVKAGLALDQKTRLQASDAIAKEQAAHVRTLNQIIQISGVNGTNTFGPHAPFDEVLTILDVMRTEVSDVSFLQKVVATLEVRSQDQTATNVEAVTLEVLKEFDATDLQNMAKALQGQKTLNNDLFCQNLIQLKRIQEQQNFSFMSAFSGFEGVDFSTINFDNILGSVNFDSLKTGLASGLAAVKEIGMKEIGDPFGQAVINVTGAIKQSSKQIFASVSGSMESVNFNKVLSKLDDETKKKSLGVSQIKTLMQNAKGSADRLQRVKDDVNESTKIYGEKIDQMQALAIENSRIDSSLVLIQQAIDSK